MSCVVVCLFRRRPPRSTRTDTRLPSTTLCRSVLRHRILGGGRHLAFVGRAERTDIIHRVKIADVLERVGDGLDEVVFADDDAIHGCSLSPLWQDSPASLDPRAWAGKGRR